MKRYIWMVVLFAVTGVGASENPFEISENFQKIQKEQDDLLAELKRASEKLEAMREAEEDAEIDAEDDEEGEESESVSKEVKQPSGKEVSQKSKVTPPPSKTIAKVPSAVEKVKEEQMKIDAAREAQMKARAEEDAKRKAAIEKERKEKEALKKLEEQRKIAEKKAKEIAQKKQQAQQANAAPVKKVAKKQDNSVMPKQSKRASGIDINVTREKLEAAKKAEEELRKAIQEVDQED